MSTNPTPAFELTVGPNTIRIPVQPQAASYNGVQRITDNGASALVVHESVERILSGRTSCHFTKAPSWITVPHSGPYHLAPGQTVSVPFTVHVAAHQTGSAAIVASAVTTGKTHHNARLGGAVGTRVTLGSGTTSCPVAAPISHSSGAPLGLLILVACLAAALIAGVVLVARKLRSQS